MSNAVSTHLNDKYVNRTEILHALINTDAGAKPVVRSMFKQGYVPLCQFGEATKNIAFLRQQHGELYCPVFFTAGDWELERLEELVTDTKELLQFDGPIISDADRPELASTKDLESEMQCGLFVVWRCKTMFSEEKMIYFEVDEHIWVKEAPIE